MQNFVKHILAILAKLTLAHYRPRVVAITGSVGKTSAKEAIAQVLKTRFLVRSSAGNYNNELGLPLTIIGEESAGRNPLVWLWVFLKGLLKLIYVNYPQVLVLELGSDRPGDIAYLVNLLGNIDVGVVTAIGISHLEFFSNPENLAKEKLFLIKKMHQKSAAVLNFDSPRVFEGQSQTKAEVMGYGFNAQAQALASDFQLIRSEGSWGINFKLHYQGTVIPFFLPNALGKPAVYAALAAAAVGLRFGLNLVEVSEALKFFTPAPGRLRFIAGIKHTSIIDDTYNSAPDSAIAALEVLSQIAMGRKFAVLGQMAELGDRTEWSHREVAAKIVENKVDVVFLVGETAKIIQDELKVRNFSGRVFWFVDSDETRIPVQNSLVEGDTVLVKGSQSMRMEKIVKEIMADPENAPKLLVRQSDKWLKV